MVTHGKITVEIHINLHKVNEEELCIKVTNLVKRCRYIYATCKNLLRRLNAHSSWINRLQIWNKYSININPRSNTTIQIQSQKLKLFSKKSLGTVKLTEGKCSHFSTIDGKKWLSSCVAKNTTIYKRTFVWRSVASRNI